MRGGPPAPPSVLRSGTHARGLTPRATGRLARRERARSVCMCVRARSHALVSVRNTTMEVPAYLANSIQIVLALAQRVVLFFD